MASGRTRLLIAVGAIASALAGCAGPRETDESAFPPCDLICQFLKLMEAGNQPPPAPPKPEPPLVRAAVAPAKRPSSAMKAKAHRDRHHITTREPTPAIAPDTLEEVPAQPDSGEPDLKALAPSGPIGDTIPGSPPIAAPWFRPTQAP